MGDSLLLALHTVAIYIIVQYSVRHKTNIMPITKGAKKANRASLRKRVFNVRRTRTMNEVVKDVRTLVSAGKADEAKALLPKAQKAIDKAAKRGVIKDNTAARKKSRLVAAIKKVS